jgi:hypothetical protein
MNFLGHDLADSKIGEIGVDTALPADQDIRRLHIAVDHPAVVRGLERVRDLRHDFYSGRERNLVHSALDFAPPPEILSHQVV